MEAPAKKRRRVVSLSEGHRYPSQHYPMLNPFECLPPEICYHIIIECTPVLDAVRRWNGVCRPARFIVQARYGTNRCIRRSDHQDTNEQARRFEILLHACMRGEAPWLPGLWNYEGGRRCNQFGRACDDDHYVALISTTYEETFGEEKLRMYHPGDGKRTRKNWLRFIRALSAKTTPDEWPCLRMALDTMLPEGHMPTARTCPFCGSPAIPSARGCTFCDGRRPAVIRGWCTWPQIQLSKRQTCLDPTMATPRPIVINIPNSLEAAVIGHIRRSDRWRTRMVHIALGKQLW